MADSKPSPWVWIFLVSLLLSFGAFIIFLDQKLVQTPAEPSQPAVTQDRETKPTIDFYSVLPQREVEIPVTEQEQEAIDNPVINKEAIEQFILQVGSFKSEAEADSLKAQLAFLGLEAKIVSADVDSVTWHRVQLGPFASNTKLSQAKNRLLEHKIEYMQRSAVN